MHQAAAILAGGASSRFGRDKALVRIGDDDQPLLACLIERLGPLVDELFIVAPDRPDYRRFDAPLVIDLHPGEGPLGGILTALRATHCDRCLVVACDLPLLNPVLLRWMLEHPDHADAIVPVIPGTSRQGERLIWQATQAIYRTSALGAIEEAFRQGERKLARLFDSIRVEPIALEALVRFDPGLRSFFSINTAADLAQVQSWRRSVGMAGSVDAIY